jgi:peptide/nickel transport system substrate-binding protein
MMLPGMRARVSIVSLIIVLIGCAAPAAPGSEPQAAAPAVPAAAATAKPTVLRFAKEVEVAEFASRLGGRQGGAHRLVNAFLAQPDQRGVVQPYLATRLPSQDDGSWLVNPDGTMRTTWTLRPGVKWQDGQPFTAQDVEFAYRVYLDPEVTLVEDTFPERLMSGVVARDDRTVDVSWKQLYFRAGQPEGPDLTPLPRHLLEDLYTRDKQAFNRSSFWTTEEYVGLGPYRVIKRELGVGVTLNANPDFFLGKPAIDIIEMSVIADPNTVVARLLSGDLEFAEHRLILLEQAGVLQEQWKSSNAGRIFTTPSETVTMGFQMRDVPNHQAGLRDVRVRRALVHAIDREALALAGSAGFAPAADTAYAKDHPLFARMDAAIMKYPYDPRRTEQLMAEAGWTKGTDGLFRNAGGQLFDIEVNVSDIFGPIAPVVADDWKRVGFDSRIKVLSSTERLDRYIRTHFPGVNMESRAPFTYLDLTSAELPTEGNQWRGTNRASWVNPDFDARFARFNQAVNPAERDELAVQLERIVTSEVGQARLFSQVRAAAARSTLQGVKGHNGESYMFNIHEWSMQ